MLCRTVGTEQRLEVSQQANGVQLAQEAVVPETVPQFDDKAADQSGELECTDTSSQNRKKGNLIQ